MASFLRLGEDAIPAPKPLPVSQASSQSTVSVLERHGMSRALDCTPTHELLAELEKTGIALPSETELLDLSRKLNKWLAEYRVLHGQNSKASWFNLFALVDQDGSGFVTYDELTNAIRQKLFKTEKDVPTSTIKALWCKLDANGSNMLEKDEMASFLRLGSPDGPKKARSQPVFINQRPVKPTTKRSSLSSTTPPASSKQMDIHLPPSDTAASCCASSREGAQPSSSTPKDFSLRSHSASASSITASPSSHCGATSQDNRLEQKSSGRTASLADSQKETMVKPSEPSGAHHKTSKSIVRLKARSTSFDPPVSSYDPILSFRTRSPFSKKPHERRQKEASTKSTEEKRTEAELLQRLCYLGPDAQQQQLTALEAKHPVNVATMALAAKREERARRESEMASMNDATTAASKQSELPRRPAPKLRIASTATRNFTMPAYLSVLGFGHDYKTSTIPPEILEELHRKQLAAFALKRTRSAPQLEDEPVEQQNSVPFDIRPTIPGLNAPPTRGYLYEVGKPPIFDGFDKVCLDNRLDLSSNSKLQMHSSAPGGDVWRPTHRQATTLTQAPGSPLANSPQAFKQRRPFKQSSEFNAGPFFTEEQLRSKAVITPTLRSESSISFAMSAPSTTDEVNADKQGHPQSLRLQTTGHRLPPRRPNMSDELFSPMRRRALPLSRAWPPKAGPALTPSKSRGNVRRYLDLCEMAGVSWRPPPSS